MAQTLLDYLRQQNPTLGQIHHKSGSTNTKNSQYKVPQRVARWEGFDSGTLQKMYPILLNRVRTRDALGFRPVDLQVKGENGGFSDVVYCWNREIVVRALEETREYIRHGDLVYMVRGEKARHPQGATKGFRPDWAAILLDADGKARGSSPTNFLPGETKYSEKWRSAWVEVGDFKHMFNSQNELPEWFKPLAQVFTYCYHLKTRYAYIITDEELVLFRVGPSEDGPEPSPTTWQCEVEALRFHGKIEFVSVPWINGRSEEGVELGGPNELSVNTALWWIHLQAAHKNSIEWTYPSLEEEILAIQDSFRLEDDVMFPRNDSCGASAVYTPTERAASVASDILPSFVVGQETAQFAIPRSSAASYGLRSRRRNAGRNQATSSFGSDAPNTSFVSHSSITSNKNRVKKPKAKISKRGRPERSNSGNNRGNSKKS
ncbi:hypothetical protein PSPO01_02234 [Paraphaeosphaeria sporulosa]